MDETSKKNLRVYSLVAIVIAFLFLSTAAIFTAAGARVTCQDLAVPYTSSTEDDSTLDEGIDNVLTVGVDGSRHVCTRASGKIISDEVTLQPVNEVIAHGTRQPEYDEDYYQEEPTYGSICNDGWHSPSVGRGACSWHGGVAY